MLRIELRPFGGAASFAMTGRTEIAEIAQKSQNGAAPPEISFFGVVFPVIMSLGKKTPTLSCDRGCAIFSLLVPPKDVFESR